MATRNGAAVAVPINVTGIVSEAWTRDAIPMNTSVLTNTEAETIFNQFTAVKRARDVTEQMLNTLADVERLNVICFNLRSLWMTLPLHLTNMSCESY